MLRRSHLIVLRLCGHAQLPQFLVYIFHKRSDTLADRSEIVIVQLLSFRRHSPKQGTP